MTSQSHKLWRHYLASYDVTISLVMTSLSHKLWRHCLVSYDVTISQVMTSQSHKLWRHYLVMSHDMTSSNTCTYFCMSLWTKTLFQYFLVTVWPSWLRQCSSSRYSHFSSHAVHVLCGNTVTPTRRDTSKSTRVPTLCLWVGVWFSPFYFEAI